MGLTDWTGESMTVVVCFITTGDDCEEDYDACEESPCDVFLISSQAMTVRSNVRNAPVTFF